MDSLTLYYSNIKLSKGNTIITCNVLNEKNPELTELVNWPPNHLRSWNKTLEVILTVER